MDEWESPVVRVCPPGECKDFWSDTDQDSLTRILCGWCGKEYERTPT